MSDLKQRQLLLHQAQRDALALQRLEKAQQLLKKGWVKNYGGDKIYETYCTMTAINTASGLGHNANNHDNHAQSLVAAELPPVYNDTDADRIIDWNDHDRTTKRMVIGLFQRLINRLRKQQPQIPGGLR